jgi:hypothetical protein
MAGTESLSRPPAAGSEFMNTAQVAEWIGIPAGTLRNWRHRNIGPACGMDRGPRTGDPARRCRGGTSRSPRLRRIMLCNIVFGGKAQ